MQLQRMRSLQSLSSSNGESIFNGVYLHQKDLKYSRFLRELGLGFVERCLQQCRQPQIVIADVKGGQLSVETVSGLTGKATEKRIAIGEEQTDVLLNGEVVKTVTVREGDSTLISRIRRSNGSSIEIRQEFSQTSLIVIITMEGTDLRAARYFKRVFF